MAAPRPVPRCLDHAGTHRVEHHIARQLARLIVSGDRDLLDLRQFREIPIVDAATAVVMITTAP
jgi:hypothetical protein